MRPRTVILTDGEQRATLAAARSLGAAGWRCVVTSSSHGSIAGGSRFVARTVSVPDPLTHATAFADAIIALAASECATVVLPMAEQSVLAILPVRTRLSPAIVPFPDLDSFCGLTDKERLLEQASMLGIAVPSQTVVRDIDAFGSIDLASLAYPIVVKPARSIGGRDGGRARFGVSYAADSGELLRVVSSLPAGAYPLLLQQRVVGPGIGIFLLVWDGELIAQFAHQRLSEKPPSGGESVYRESIPIDEELRDQSRALLDRFGWRGVAMVEYKRDIATGKPYLMEVNGRFWGSLQLAIDSGVDFPRLLLACALGESLKSVPPYRVGVRSRWWWGQVDHLVGRVRRSRGTSPALPATRSAGRVVGDLLLGPLRSADYEEVLRWTDPLPFWNETIRWIARR